MKRLVLKRKASRIKQQEHITKYKKERKFGS